MGVPQFFRYISERYPCLSEYAKEYQMPDFDNLYLDMNGIIHVCSHPNDADVDFRITEEDIFKAIFHYVEALFRIIRPRKLFFMAVDGVAPRAKMNQQRGRRFRTAKEDKILEARAKSKGKTLSPGEKFDSNCITPGTVFMAKLNEQLKHFITHKITTDKQWQKCKVILSGHETPGEGEHKIMDYIRYMKAQPDYDCNTRHCLYGLDADLIMLGLCTHEPHFSLLREEVKFGKKQKRIATPEETRFCLLHLSLMREYLEHEFSPVKEKLSFEFDIEKIIDDWVLMGFLVGNDFIPHLPNLHIANGALPLLYRAYMEVLPTLDGYINEYGVLKLDRFEKFMERLSRIDVDKFAEHYADMKYFESKTGRRPNELERHVYKKSEGSSAGTESPVQVVNKDLEALIKSTDDMLIGHSDEDEPLELDEDSDSDIYNMEFVQHKRDYYMNKLEYENVDEKVLRSQAECYVRAIQWNLHYYYHGCHSWSWFYPHHYAPYISDIKDFKDLKLEFDMGEPFLPFQQLLAVLPSASKTLLPEPFQKLMTEEESPIVHFYPTEFKTDLNGKRQEWEAVVLIPIIDEKNLLKAMEPYYEQLTEEERRRNSHGPMCIFSYTEEDLGAYNASDNFPPLTNNHAKLVLVNREEILVPKEKLVRELYPGVKLDVYFPGFPTLRHIKHTASLAEAKVKVFEQQSRGENMILHILPREIPKLDDLAKELLGNIVYVSWPHLTKARVVAVSNNESKLSLSTSQSNDSDNSFHKEEVKGALASQWGMQRSSIAETYKNRLGIDVGDTEILIHACPLVGLRYIYGTQGQLFLENQWNELPVAYAYQATVKEIEVHNDTIVQYKNIREVFTPKSVCFMLGHPHYGATGEVLDPAINEKNSRVMVAMRIAPEPNLDKIIEDHAKSRMRYMHGSIAAQRLGISSHLLSRITGTIYVLQGPSQQTEHSKHNIGLNLKFNKKNEEVPGYTKKENGQWLYSGKAVNLIRSYMEQCPELFERLSKNVSNDIFHEDELFPARSNKLSSLMTWLKEQPFYSVESRTCGAEGLEPEVVQKIEKEVDAFLKSPHNTLKTLKMHVKPHLLYKPGLNSRNFPPDPKAEHCIYDKIVCVRDSFTVPLGYKGTIIGIHKAKITADDVYDVVFDKPFTGGLSLNMCSENRGYRLSPTDFINLTYGFRVENNMKPVKTGLETTAPEQPLSWRQPKNAQNQTNLNTSAFASFSEESGCSSPFLKGNQQSTPVAQQQGRFVKRSNEQRAQIYRAPHLRTAPTKTQEDEPVQQVLEKTVAPVNSAKNVETSKLPNLQKPNQASEFQVLWNELQKMQAKPAEPLKTAKPVENATNTSVNSPSDPSAVLKAILNISDGKSETRMTPQTIMKPPSNPSTFPQTSKTSNAPPLVQQLFDHARQVGSQKEKILYAPRLLTHFQLNGMGIPRYTYISSKDTNLTCAQINLPDRRIFAGDFCSTIELATESAAKKVFEELQLDKAPKPLINILAPPPRQWFGNRQNIHPPNVRPSMAPPPQHTSTQMQTQTQNPKMPSFNWNQNAGPPPPNTGFMPMLAHTSGANRPQQIRPHPPWPKNPPKSWSKSEPKKTTPFVPLQAQKQTRNSSSKNVPKETTSRASNATTHSVPQQKPKSDPPQESTQERPHNGDQNDSQNVQKVPQNQPKLQKATKQRRSRIAAKFGCPPLTNGGEQSRGDSV